MTTHKEILDRFKSARQLSEAIEAVTGQKVPVTTVQSWKNRGNVPFKWFDAIILAGKTFRPTIKVKRAEFFGGAK